MERHGRSLAEIPPDRAVVVRRILFECLRERCGELGLREGDRLSLSRRDREALVLRTGDGGSVHCPVGLARFVEIVGVVN
jgi:hypothetical protein